MRGDRPLDMRVRRKETTTANLLEAALDAHAEARVHLVIR